MNKKMINKLFVILVAIIFIAPKYVSAITRNELEDYVVSTALSYYYNNVNTDYEGYEKGWAEESKSTWSVDYNMTPEMVCRSKEMVTECMAFVATTYIHSLGYDFSNYYGILADDIYNKYKNAQGEFELAKNSELNMKNAYKYFNKVYKVGLGHTIAREYPNDDIVIATYQQGVTSTFPGITDYSQAIADMSEADKNTLISDLEQMLRPGDIILNNGHAMLWVGDALEETGGIIHSTGNSFVLSNSATSGYDPAAVYYSSKDYLIEKQIKTHGGEANTKLTILRPINAFCNGGESNPDACDVPNNLQDNTKARTKFKNLKVESYIYNPIDGTTMSADTSSINEGDLLSYRLSLKNESGQYFCSIPILNKNMNTESECVDRRNKCYNNSNNDPSYCETIQWKQNKNSENYSGIKIVAHIPDNTELYDCNGCSASSDGTITWENVSVNIGDDDEYYYTVKPIVNDTTIVNDGFEISIDGNSPEYTLKTAKIKTRVNDSIVGKYRSKLRNMVDTDLDDTNLKEYSTPQEYIADLYQRFYIENPSVSNKAFSDILDGNKIANAIFTKNSFDEYYVRKSQSDVNSLAGTEKIINEMMVPYFYGGKKYEHLYYKNNMDYYYRVKPLYGSGQINFNYGDIIVLLAQDGDNYNISNAILYTGDEDDTSFTHYNDGTLTKQTQSTNPKAKTFFMRQIYSADLYVVLRPSQYYDVDMITVPDEIIEEDKANNPKTGMIRYIGIMFILVSSLAITYSYKRKVSKKDK